MRNRVVRLTLCWKKIGNMRKHIKYLFVFLLCLAAAGLYAANISVRASVNKTALALDDELTLTVTVDGAAGHLTPQLPSLPAFNVYSRSTSTQIYNGHAITIFEYIMTPRFPGQTSIGPITITHQNQTYQTDPIPVTVYRTSPQNPTSAATTATTHATTDRTAPKKSPAATRQDVAQMPLLERTLHNLAASKAGQNYFMVAAVSDKAPYANQTFTLAVRFYYSQPFSGSAPYTAPSISNLFLEEIGRSDGRQQIGGTFYEYIEIRYGATGVTAGKAEIGPAAISYIPMSSRNVSIFKMFTAATESPRTTQSQPITLSIRAVPSEGQPHSFYGAVGSGYSLTASLDSDQVEAGDAVNLTVKVNGPGNLKPTQDLKLPALPNFKTYDVVASGGVVAANGALKSYKIFKTVLVPVSSGTYTIPALSWSYYDPSLAQYRTLKTEPLLLQVTPASKTDMSLDFRAKTDGNGGIQTVGQDIHYIKSSYAPAAAMNWLAQAGRQDWLALGSLILLVLVAFASLVGRRPLSAQAALSKAKSLLKKARREEDIAAALSVYLQMKFNLHTASYTLRQIQDALAENGCSQEIISSFTSLWQQLEAARFAPVALQNKGCSELAQQALQLLLQLNKGGRK